MSVASQNDFNRILNINMACSPYSLPEVEDLRNKTMFPPLDQIADIPDGDLDAKNIWETIRKSGIIPTNVTVKKDNDDNHTSVNQNGYDQTDPDCWFTATGCTQPKHGNLTMDLTRVPTPNTLGFTIGDAPNCSHNALYNALQQNNLKATLFYVGSSVIKYPYQAQRGITDGHDICVQSWSNPYLTTLSNEQVFSELYYTALAIKGVLDVTPTCWRPPFGDVDDRVRAIAYGLGLRTIMYDTDVTSSQGYSRVANKDTSSSPIIQVHEATNSSMSIIIDHLSDLKDAYKFVLPITACMNITQPYAEDIRYPNFLEIQDPKFSYHNLPQKYNIKAKATPKYTVVPLDEMTFGFANSLNATGNNATFPAQTDAKGSAASLIPPSATSLVLASVALSLSQLLL
ncbi:hypothetical protein MNAN1_003131 [Malassezia nana]|uniref:chitin deacetylase n=1 Tax=Malassezia nana TaxID=180528 RepID=A0AAF0ELA5_9BASI|nr:hypothetical protein MNAN1_003131 [Malassezia nana]